MTSVPALQAQQQQNAPRIGYLYPAGGRQGETFQITVGGQFLDEEAKVFVSGGGIRAKVVSLVKPLNPRQINELRQKIEELQKQPRNPALVKEMVEIRQKLAAARNLMNPGIAEKATLEIVVDAGAALEPRELRLETANGLSNPLAFHVGQLSEFREKEPEKTDEPPFAAGLRRNFNPPPRKPEIEMNFALPAVLNGQILPGDVDRYRFQARKGRQLVVAVAARKLIPYLADAVPGWFQAAAALYDSSGNELAYDDDYRFHPDPVLSCKIPRDGAYVLEIRDALYRGREDFVYRIVVGELPFVSSIFPLGGPAGAQTAVDLTGWNLPLNKLTVDADLLAPKTASSNGAASRIFPISVNKKGTLLLDRLSFAVDTLPECREIEPNNAPAAAQSVALPIVVNGRIDAPGDLDIFRFEGRAGQKIVAQVDARKLGSPLDSTLKLADADGRQLAINDDCADKGDGLSTHHADSYLTAELPAAGAYYFSLGDAQHKGGAEYAYRLRLGAPRPDFALRVVPSAINVRAGGSVPITVYALRKDGFAGDILLSLKNAPKGFSLSRDPRIPAKEDQVKITLTAPQFSSPEPISFDVEGRAVIDGREIVRQAVPADDLMQAFFYHHLVPAERLLVTVIRRVPPQLQLRYAGQGLLKIPAGQTAALRFSGPRGPMLNQLQLTLKDPPEGIIVEKVSSGSEGLDLLLHADAEKVKSGQKGNLLVDVSIERSITSEKGKPQTGKRRVPLGTLPAIPFEITDPVR
ncbi:MAG: PPC domain-containing protein [Pirellulales bacterium]|nr:PPC domain-containing protein [Pirellulales bacterium]